MPITRDFNEKDIQNFRMEGRDPTPFIGKQITVLTPEEAEAQQQQQQQVQPLTQQPSSLLKAIGHTAETRGGGMLGGGLAGLAAAEYTPFAHVAPPWSEAIAGAVGALGGGYLGQKAQNAIQGPERTARLEQEQEQIGKEHPFAVPATEIAGSALAGGGMLKPSNIPKALRGIFSREALEQIPEDYLSTADTGAGIVARNAERVARNAENAKALKSVAFNAAVNPAINTGVNFAATGQLPSGKDLAMQAAGGALFSGQNALGRMVQGNRGELQTSPKASGDYVPKVGPNPDELNPVAKPKSDWLDATKTGDAEVKKAFLQLNPKPNPGDTDDYLTRAKANTEWKAKVSISVDEMRQQLDSYEASKITKDIPKVKIPETQPVLSSTEERAKVPEPSLAAHPSPIIDNVPEAGKLPLNPEQQTKANDFEKARAEVVSQQHDETTPIVKQPTPITENQARIINPEKLASDIQANTIAKPENWLSKAGEWADERLARLDEESKNMNGNPLVVLDPTVLAAHAIKGAQLISRGIHEFGAWSHEMLKQAGESIRPYLQEIYDRAQQMIKDNGAQIRANIESLKPVGGKVGATFRSAIEKISELPNRSAQKVADAFRNTFNERQELVGRWLNPILRSGQHLSDISQERLNAAKRFELENKQPAPMSMFRTQAERQTWTNYKAALKDNFEYRLQNEEPVFRNGKPTMPQRDEFYHPTTPNPKVVETIKVGTDANKIAALKKDFIDYQTKIGAKNPEENYQTIVDAFKGNLQSGAGMGNQQNYNAARKAQGIPLPPSWERPGFMKNVESYFHRMATDNAFYKHIEKNDEVMSALGEPSNPWGKLIPKHPDGVMANNPEVRATINELRGESGGAGFHNEKALSSLATSAMLGYGTEIHKFIADHVQGVAKYISDPRQFTAYVKGALSNRAQSLEHSYENGVIRLTAKPIGNIITSDMGMADTFRRVTSVVRDVSTLGGLTDKLGTSMLQGAWENVLPLKVASANKGNLTDQNLLRRLDTSYVPGKEYSSEDFSKMASHMINQIRGTGDARTLPHWMLGDSEISGFFKLSHWTLAQTNSFFNDVIAPTRHGDYKPLIMSAFGSAVGGYMIKELREKLQGKHGQIPSLQEIASGEAGLSGNKSLVAYNLMAAATYAGFGGMLSMLGKVPFDMIYKNQAQGMIFPLDEWVSDIASTASKLTTAATNDPNFNWYHAAQYAMAHELTSNFQFGRIVYNQAINNEIITGDLAEKKELADKLGELRRFDMVQGLPYAEQDAAGNPYMNLEQKQFKLTTDMNQAVKELPGLVNNIIQSYHDKPDVMMSKLKALKENSYSTMPSLETMPIEMMKYVAYLDREKGPGAGQAMLQDYLRHKMINEAKGEMVP